MARLYLNERKWREVGFSEADIRTLRKLTEFVEAQEALSAAQGAIDANEADLATLTTANNALAARVTTAEGDIDTLQSAGPYVEQDQAAAPSFSGQTISNPPTQAEVQAIDDALAGLITALQTANVLT